MPLTKEEVRWIKEHVGPDANIAGIEAIMDEYDREHGHAGTSQDPE